MDISKEQRTQHIRPTASPVPGLSDEDFKIEAVLDEICVPTNGGYRADARQYGDLIIVANLLDGREPNGISVYKTENVIAAYDEAALAQHAKAEDGTVFGEVLRDKLQDAGTDPHKEA